MADPLPTGSAIELASKTSFNIVNQIEPGDWVQIAILGSLMLGCLIVSAISSGSENAFFSHRESDLEALREETSAASKSIVKLLDRPKHLLATILMINSLVNVAFVLLTLNLTEIIFNLHAYPWIKFLIEAVLVTLIILVFGEVVPKVFATQNYKRAAKFLVYPMRVFVAVLWPFTHLLVKLGWLLEKGAKPKANELTSEELAMAIDMATDQEDAKQEKEILKGIVNMGNIQVKQIMKPRMDVVAVEANMGFDTVVAKIREHGFSRMPVYDGNLDKMIGVINIKSLMPHLEKGDSFQWNTLMLQPYFIPENKPMDDTLAEMRLKHNHLAIVVDEFGGTSGIITMEDILEEVFGDMNDEFDEENEGMVHLADQSIMCEGKVLLIDFVRFAGLQIGVFDDYELESDSLGGVVSERLGRIPKRGDEIELAGIRFRVESADTRKVKKIKVWLTR